ncbi:hypothetical protein CH363_10120 [Leptospira haakeii]|uniref:DUF1574 domain-containing protein n=1 Tax=Leptospira haakeii TaxID=2023198 RepID=A0ABX4PJQ9_9LEPT|nr:hypothetical protein CH363_10120 [Leptospira haakeii]PKA19385.1 hypothetical protein CH377_12295 [Leptospira haakeii]
MGLYIWIVNFNILVKKRERQKFVAFLIPIIALSAYLIVDKVFLIKPLRDKLAAYLPYTENFLPLINNDDLVELDYINSKNVFLALGTSRSIAFNGYPNPGYTRKDPFLTPQIAHRMENWEGLSTAMAGASMRLMYARLLQTLEKGWTPDFVIVEISMMSFSKNGKFKEFLKQNVIPSDFAVKHHKELGLPAVWNILYPKMFLSYKYQFSPKNFWRLLQGENRDWELTFFGLAGGTGYESVRKKDRKKLESGNFKDYNVLTLGKGPIYKEFFEDCLFIIKQEAGTNTYTVDSEELEYLEKTIALLKARKIPTVYWRPRVHPILNNYERVESNWVEFETKVLDTLRRSGVHYVDANELPMKCDYFSDASHLSRRCYTELSSFLLPVR